MSGLVSPTILRVIVLHDLAYAAANDAYAVIYRVAAIVHLDLHFEDLGRTLRRQLALLR